MIKIGFVQTSPEFGKKDRNFKQVENLIKNKTADLLVLPELFASGYTFISKNEAKESSETLNGPTASFLQNIAKDIGGYVVAGFPEKDGEHIYNSCMLVDKNGVMEVYRKIHLFNKEKLWFNPGKKNFPVIELKKLDGVKVGMMICFDWIFPEATRTLALKGADIIAHPTNLVLPYCQNAMKVRSLSNHVFAITCNRIGREKREGEFGKDDFTFTGKSQVTNQKGIVLIDAPKDKSLLKTVSIDFNLARDKNLNDYNHLFNDRNEKFYWK